jgi:hypothetical protein
MNKGNDYNPIPNDNRGYNSRPKAENDKEKNELGTKPINYIRPHTKKIQLKSMANNKWPRAEKNLKKINLAQCQ